MKKLVAVILLVVCSSLLTANLAHACSFSDGQAHGWNKHHVQVPPDSRIRD